MEDVTTIQISKENWRWLHSHKKPGDSFDDALGRVRNLVDEPNTVVQESTVVDDTTDVSLEDVEFPAGRDPTACIEAVHAARDYLDEHGPASMREIVVDVMPDHSLGYDVPELEPGDRYRGAWWRKVIKPGLEALDGVEKPPRGGSDWRTV